MKGRRRVTSLVSSNFPSTRPFSCLMVRSSRITPGFRLPRPVYRASWYMYALRRRRRGTPRPRSPFIHFALDCILQRKITFGDKFNFSRISRTIRSIWFRMGYEQRGPWIHMAELDRRTISRIYGMHHVRHGGKRQVSRRRCNAMQVNHELATDSSSSSELPFLEVHRQRYSTPERSTYSLGESLRSLAI